MSHFTYIKTCFQNLFYLEKALNKLNIVYKEQEKTISNSNLERYNKNLLIPQSNDSDIEFVWNSQEYELVIDRSFWKQLCPIESFIDKIAHQYACEVIIGESQKMGFQPMKSKKNTDSLKRLVLQRWNSKKIN